MGPRHLRTREVHHEAANESEAKTYEADATKFGLEDLTSLKISLSLIATQPHMKHHVYYKTKANSDRNMNLSIANRSRVSCINTNRSRL